MQTFALRPLPTLRPTALDHPSLQNPSRHPHSLAFTSSPRDALVSSPSHNRRCRLPLYLPRLPLPLSPARAYSSSNPSAPPFPSPPPDGASDAAKLAQVAKRLESTSRYFKRLGSLGFWGQLVCIVVAAVILSFSTVITGKVTAAFTFYATAAGIAAAFVSVFWSFGYIRLSEKLRRTANEPSKAPPRAEVVKSLRNGIVLNMLGMGAAVLGLQATVGSLVAKSITTSPVPYYQGINPGQSPVLALDVFLVQACSNTILSHFLGLVFSLELLRSVSSPTTESVPIPKPA